MVITRKGKVAARLVGPKNGDEKAGENWVEGCTEEELEA